MKYLILHGAVIPRRKYPEVAAKKINHLEKDIKERDSDRILKRISGTFRRVRYDIKFSEIACYRATYGKKLRGYMGLAALLEIQFISDWPRSRATSMTRMFQG